MIKYIDIFYGIRSFHQGMTKQLKTKCLISCDINKSFRKGYKLKYNIKPDKYILNIKKFNIQKIDVIFVAFPYHSFLNINKQEIIEKNHKTLINNIIMIIEKTKPKSFVFSNTKDLLSEEKGEIFKLLVNILSNYGYSITYKVLKASNYGIPQNKQSLFIVGVKNNIKYEFEWPEQIKTLSLVEYRKLFETDIIYNNIDTINYIDLEKMKTVCNIIHVNLFCLITNQLCHVLNKNNYTLSK